MLRKMVEKTREWVDSLRPVEDVSKGGGKQETPWLDIALGDLQLDWKERPGKEHNPRIVEAFKLCGYPGMSDETSWCGVYVGSRLSLAGYKRPSEPAWARNYTNRVPEYGVILKRPRIGCIVNIERGAPGGTSHVGFVVGWDDTHIRILGGNQSNTVNASLVVPREKVISFTWPVKQV